MTRFLIERPYDDRIDPGVTGNTRLTASTGIVLTALLLVEGVTILDVRGYLTLHTAIGLVLVGPIVLKCVTTIYRFARYYTGADAYVRRGAPPAVLRIIGPLVVLSSLAVLGHRHRADPGSWRERHLDHAAPGELHRVDLPDRRALPRTHRGSGPRHRPRRPWRAHDPRDA